MIKILKTSTKVLRKGGPWPLPIFVYFVRVIQPYFVGKIWIQFSAPPPITTLFKSWIC